MRFVALGFEGFGHSSPVLHPFLLYCLDVEHVVVHSLHQHCVVLSREEFSPFLMSLQQLKRERVLVQLCSDTVHLYQTFPFCLFFQGIITDLPNSLIYLFLIIETQLWVEEFFHDLVDMEIGALGSIHFLANVEHLGLIGCVDLFSLLLQSLIRQRPILELYLSPFDQYLLPALEEGVQSCP